MALQRGLKNTGQVAFIILEAVASAADVCPPLKSAAVIVLQIVNMVKGFKSNANDWNAFGNYVQDHIATLFQHIPDINNIRGDIRRDLEKLTCTLETIGKEIEALSRESRLKRFTTFIIDPGKIDDMRKQLDEAIKVFMVARQLNTGLDVAMILDTLRSDGIRKILDGNTGAIMSKIEHFIAAERSQIENKLDISILRYTKDAAWNGNLSCLVNTRNSVVDTVLEWIKATDINGSEKVYLLAGVLGSGKTTLAHTVAGQCFNDSLLLSSFFFNREAGRTSRDFISTLALDLGRRSSDMKELISAALRKEPDLARSQSITRFFRRVVLEPVTSCHIDGPLVIIIDALDESDCQKELLAIIRDKIPKMPGAFRFFITTRPERNILRGLRPGIQLHELGIYEKNNLGDIAVLLFDIALDNDLPKDWPGTTLTDKFLAKAEGLFIWVATVCDYLQQAAYPDKTLENLLDGTRGSCLPPEKRMDSLYTTILARCAWEDDYFVEGYQQVMGVVIVAKEPMSVNALQAIHGPEARLKPRAILRELASLVTGSLTNIEGPTRILHESFRDFITLRSSPPRHIRAKEHHARLAVLSFRILCDIFNSVSIEESGYLSGLSEDKARNSTVTIPDLNVDHISEAGWYAVKFWSFHVIKVARPDQEMISMMETFLSTHLITWVEVLISKESYKSLIHVRRWLHTTLPQNGVLRHALTNGVLAKSLKSLVILLGREGRKQEALDVLDELTQMLHQALTLPKVYHDSDDSDDPSDDSSISDISSSNIQSVVETSWRMETRETLTHTYSI